MVQGGGTAVTDVFTGEGSGLRRGLKGGLSWKYSNKGVSGGRFMLRIPPLFSLAFGENESCKCRQIWLGQTDAGVSGFADLQPLFWLSGRGFCDSHLFPAGRDGVDGGDQWEARIVNERG